MRLYFALLVAGLIAALVGAQGSMADIPPPYEVYGIGAQLVEGKAFPEVRGVVKGGPADKAGVRDGDNVIAINGGYVTLGSGAPFYFIARMLGGPEDSEVALILLRAERQVIFVKVKRKPR